jgi:hypothetical protein
MNGHFATRMLDERGELKDISQLKNSSADISPTAAQMPRLVGLAYASKLFRNNASLSAFTNLPETCYMLACWRNMDHDEKSPDLEFVGSRPFDLTEEEQSIFMKLAKQGQEHIEEILRNFNEEDYDNWN